MIFGIVQKVVLVITGRKDEKVLNSKIFEIRDRGTLLPVMATLVSNTSGENYMENNLMLRAGYGNSGMVILTILESGESRNDPFKWNDGCRTIKEAHWYINNNFYKLNSGDVIDVEYILGESDTQKVSEVN